MLYEQQKKMNLTHVFWNVLSNLKFKDTLFLQRDYGLMAQLKKAKPWLIKVYPGRNWRWNGFARYRF